MLPTCESCRLSEKAIQTGLPAPHSRVACPAIAGRRGDHPAYKCQFSLFQLIDYCGFWQDLTPFSRRAAKTALPPRASAQVVYPINLQLKRVNQTVADPLLSSKAKKNWNC